MHERYAQMFSSQDHDVIPIYDYMEDPDRYQETKCDSHEEETVHHACSKCRQVLCCLCVTDECEVGRC